jgi:hypothetical protein
MRQVDGMKHQDTSHRNKIRNCWTEWAYDRVLRQGFVSRAMNFQAAHNKDYFYTLLSKNQLSKEESVSYRVSKKQKKRLMSLT